MDTLRRIRYAVTILILLMALFVSAETAFVANVQATPTFTLTPTEAIPGTLITAGSLTGFATTDTTCTISGTPVSSPSTCTITGGVTFTVKQYAPAGVYTITITGNTGDSGQISFKVDGFNLVLTPMSGETGTNVMLTMTNVPTYDTSCSISSPSSSSVVKFPGCAVSSGVGNGTFVVGNVPVGDYVIEVTACTGNNGCAPSAGDFAQQVFNVTSVAFIQLSGINGGFASVGQVARGPVGTHVSVEGSDFLSTDTTCSISSPSSGNFIKSAGCSVFITSSGFKNVTGSFVVGSVAEGQYVVQVTGNQGDFAQAIFNVTRGAFIQLFPAKGPDGTSVNIEGSYFLSTETTCSISSPSSGSVVKSAACSTFKASSGAFLGFMNVTGSFVVGNVPTGQYVIQVSGNQGDFAQAVFNVTSGPIIQLGVNGLFASVGQAAVGPIGTHVSVEGTYFLETDSTCSLSSPSNGAIILNGACSFFDAPSGFRNVTGSFTVGNVPEGQYVIRVSGNGGDFAQAIFNVTAGAFIQLSGLNGGFVKIGQVASGPTGTHVNVEGSQFLANDGFNSARCSLSSPTSGSIIVDGACSFFKVPSGFVNVTGSFIVGNVNPGQYVIQVSGSAGDSAQAIFNVTTGPFIQLTGITGGFASLGQAASGPVGTHVSVSGSNFLPTDRTCSISSPTSGFIQSVACSTFTPSSGFKNVTGSFIVGNVPEGQYLVQVTGNQGDFAQAIFNVTRGAFIQLFPAKGPDGTSVNIEGSYFLSTETTCSIFSPTYASIIQGAACSVFKASSGTFLGFMNVTGSFIVGNVLPGEYVIQVTGNRGDFAQAIFNVTTGPFVQLIVGTIHYSVGQTASGPIGTPVNIEGSFFISRTTTCTISSPTSGSIISGAGCSVFIPSSGPFLGFANVTGSFIVGNVLPGQYVIQVTGNEGSFAQAIFNVTTGPRITLSPGTARPGQSVIVNGTGFLPTDQSCSISSPGSSAVLSGSAGCAKQAGGITISGSFIVGNVVPGQYVIEVTGCQGNVGCTPSVGDFAQAVLNVTGGPQISLTPANGAIGRSIVVSGSGFLTTDQSCSISSISSPNPVLHGSAGCAITVGTGIVSGSFIIGNVPLGEYVIEVTGCAGNNGCAPSAGDFAQTVLNVTQAGLTLILLPTSAVEGSTVTFIGTGLSPSDTGCTVEAFSGPPPTTPDSTLITAATCSIVSPGIAQGTFVVSPYATSDISWYVVVEGSPANDLTPGAAFTVMPDVIVTPTSGTVNTVFTFTGSGFSSAATTCVATTTPATVSGTPTCSIDNGQVTGSVTPAAGTTSGTYGLTVTPNTGATAIGIFTVGTPSALIVLNPASVEQDQPVGVAGFGFNPSDTYCTITAGTNVAPWSGLNGVAPNCAISGGYVSGSFVVSSTAPGGYYLVTVTGYTGAGNATRGDFASNFLGVTLATTVTTFSSTTSTSTTTTAFSTTTTSVATSFTYYSTTLQTTGILFTTYTHLTQTTVSGQTTSTQTQLTSTTQIQTTVTYSTISQFTTVPCGPLPCGFAVKPQTMNLAPGVDSAGLLAALLLLLPMLLRRLFS